MVRRTKQAAEQTRADILHAARTVFAQRGVNGTTLEQVAKAAGVTRGAVYWHFADKIELFFAMRELISLPLLDRIEGAVIQAENNDPLGGVHTFLSATIAALAEDEATRQTYEIVLYKCEYVGAFEPVLDQWMGCCQDLVGKLCRAYEKAAEQGQLRQGLAPKALALDTYCFFSGLVRLWAGDKSGTLVRSHAAELIDTHIASRRP